MAVATKNDPAAFALGERTPRAVVTPPSVAALAALLQESNANGDAVVFFGGGTLQGIGYPPERYDLAISLRGLSKVLEYEYRDLTIAVQAGITVAAFEKALAAKGQFVPLDAPRASASTIGGVLASGWLGPRRATYGRPRDFVIGSSVVLADGTLAKAGGMVVKNSTGYDMSRLYVGSLGTLAAIVRANFKTLPLPETRRAAIAALPEHTRRRAIEHVAALNLEPAAALLVRGFAREIAGHDGLDGRLVLFFEGSAGLIERATRELRSALGAAGVPETTIVDRDAGVVFSRVLDAYVAALGERSATYRSGGVPSELDARVAVFERLARQAELELETLEDLRTGDVVARLSAERSTGFAQRAIPFDDSLHDELERVQVLVAPSALRSDLAAWGAAPHALEKMRALKARFDPQRTLAPGRFIGHI